MVVEMAFGLYKGLFRIFQTPLTQQNPHDMTRIITGTMVLHNWLIDLKSPEDIRYFQWMHIGGDPPLQGSLHAVDGQEAQDMQRMVRDYLFNNVRA
jgi:hypothetical protein